MHYMNDWLKVLHSMCIDGKHETDTCARGNTSDTESNVYSPSDKWRHPRQTKTDVVAPAAGCMRLDYRHQQNTHRTTGTTSPNHSHDHVNTREDRTISWHMPCGHSSYTLWYMFYYRTCTMFHYRTQFHRNVFVGWSTRWAPQVCASN